MKLLVAVTAICRLIVAVGLITLGPPSTTELLHKLSLLRNMEKQQQQLMISMDPSDLAAASTDFGGTARSEPMAVMYPETADDVARLVGAAYESEGGWTVSARGHGHSINGQAQVSKHGVVIQMSEVGQPRRKISSTSTNLILMTRTRGRPRPRVVLLSEQEQEEYYYSAGLSSSTSYAVDAWGGELWVDVLRATLEHGLAPKSWTDYLYLSVGGTLSNAGISGQAFIHGPQISNVLQLDVVTGKGEVVTCSHQHNSDLFHAVLGGLGQFGIITRARIALHPAPHRVRWMRVLYSNFTEFTEDQEYLISLHGEPASKRFDYVEGFVIVDEGLINNWRSSFFSTHNPWPVNISSLLSAINVTGTGGVFYCLEITKNYYFTDPHSTVEGELDEEIKALMKRLHYIPGSVFTTDVSYLDFLDRVHKAELKLRSKGLWEVPHPWLNLFVPRSKISEFDRGVFKGILGNKTTGPILIYPMNRNKWDDRMSAVTPDEEVFYLVALLRSAVVKDGDETQTLEYLENENSRILKFCRQANIGIKHYLPHYTTQQEWMNHFGDKWEQFYSLKMRYDPRNILATGQRIFPPLAPLSSSSSKTTTWL
ncbi:Cytokinin dehydrogenase 5 [Dionaea muscipula]